MKKAFNSLSFSNIKYWVEFITEPKSDDAKVYRINKLFEFLSENKSGKK
jgi:hypothetical protein